MQLTRAQAELDRLLDLHVSGDIDRDTYQKKAQIESGTKKKRVEREKLVAHLSENTFSTDEAEAALRRFAAGVAKRARRTGPFAEKVKLLDILRVQGVCDPRTGSWRYVD